MKQFLRRIRDRLRDWHCSIVLAVLIALAYTLDSNVTRYQLTLPDGQQPQLAVINIWVQIAILIVSAIISYALAPKPPVPRPASLADFSAPTAEEGRPLPVVFGTVWVTGPNVLWYGDLQSSPIKKKAGK